jgi:hypothetical protein
MIVETDVDRMTEPVIRDPPQAEKSATAISTPQRLVNSSMLCISVAVFGEFQEFL